MLPTDHCRCPTCHRPTDRIIVIRGLVVALGCRDCHLAKAQRMLSAHDRSAL